jgi:hypothetical protein
MFGISTGLGRYPYRLLNAFREARAARRAPFGAGKFETRPPSGANAIDIFAGRWATDLSKFDPEWHGGGVDLKDDQRPLLAARHLGAADRLDGMSVIELGPLEGIHTWLLAKLGARRIVAIESNVEAYLKCLIVKELLDLKQAHFLLGDFNPYLERTDERFDLAFCAGVLYHMEDPLSMIRNLSRIADRCFVWTHYYDPANYHGAERKRTSVTVDGFAATYFRADYSDRAQPVFWGGNKPSNSWMTQAEILGAFRHYGFGRVEIVQAEPTHPHGASFCFVAAP